MMKYNKWVWLSRRIGLFLSIVCRKWYDERLSIKDSWWIAGNVWGHKEAV